MNIRLPGDRDGRHYRPGPDGRQRDLYVGGVLPNVRWLDDRGIVHQAHDHSNLTLCENREKWSALLHWVVIRATDCPINCVACIGDVLWKYYPVR